MDRKTRQSFVSLKKRLVRNFLIIIFISVLAFEGMLLYFTKYYFYTNTENVLTNQIKIASEFYSKYFSDVPLEKNIIDHVDVFWKQTTAQVQIVDLSGRVLLDSTGMENKELIKSSDFQAAIGNGKGVSIEKNSNDEKVMIVSYPLISDKEVVGALRFITTLTAIDHNLRSITYVFLGFGLIVIIVAWIISLLLARSIVLPLKEVTTKAKRMADGDLKIRINKKRNDELGQLADTLNFMAGEIQDREKAKDDFISLVSHELRTPLTSIKGWAVTLRALGFEDRNVFHDGVTIIEKESDRLTNMVEQLLDFSSIVSGQVSIQKEKTDICQLIYYVEKQMSPRAIREKIQFQVECQELPPIDVDPDRIKQVLFNLLGNAFKFTPNDGSVLLRAFQEGKEIVISIKDTGCGISPEDLPRVKSKFYKGKNSQAQTGLGLSISDEIVKLHNGFLLIQSELGKGTEIKVKLPMSDRHAKK